MNKQEVSILHVLVCVFVIGNASSQPPSADVCKVYRMDGCKCFKTANPRDLHTGLMQRRILVDCGHTCDSHPCCNEGTDKHCYESPATCLGITIVTREKWEAKKPRGPIGNITKAVPQFYIHHTAGNQCSNISSCAKVLRSIQEFHFSLGWYDIGYSFLVGQDGRVYEGRGWNKVGAHTEGYNSVSYAASFMGNYMYQLPNPKSLKAAKQLIACGLEKKKIDSRYALYGHRDACGDTDCPGNDLYKDIHGWAHYNQIPNPSAGCVSHGRRCKANKSTCKPGSLITGKDLCEEPSIKNCCYKG